MLHKVIPPNLSARDRLRSEGYRISDAAEFTKQNVKGDIAGLSTSFVITGPEHKRWTGIDAAGFQTVAHMARSTNEVETHAVYIALCAHEPVRCCRNSGRIWRKMSEGRWRVDVIGGSHHEAPKLPPTGRPRTPKKHDARKSFDQDNGCGGSGQ